jgi:diguanylate cyclase (GGDEF)-like protein
VLLRPQLVPTALAGIAMLVLALRDLAATLSPPQVVGLAALVVAATLAEVFPVPVGRAPAAGVSLAALFILGAGLLYGWSASAVVALCTSFIAQMIERKEVRRLAYNAAVYTLAGGLAGLAMQAVGGAESAGVLILSALVGSVVFWAVNIALVVGAVARVTRQRLGHLTRSVTRETVVPATIMGSTTVMLVSLAQSSVYLPVTLIGPLAAITLYQRSAHRSLVAMRLALTELGNYRYFCEKLDHYQDSARDPDLRLSVCLFDRDDFKTINDTHGHPAGDAVLRGVAAAMRQDAEAFRVGGDEFALLLSGETEEEAREIAERVVERVESTEFEHGAPVTLSVGIASYPQAGIHLSELVACADMALYASKVAGKNCVSSYRPGSTAPPDEPEDESRGGVSRATGRDRAARAA